MNTTTQIPAGMREVTQEQFFEALRADPRDIMPTTKHEYFTTWETKDQRLWGWSTPGWKGPYNEKDRYAIVDRTRA